MHRKQIVLIILSLNTKSVLFKVSNMFLFKDKIGANIKEKHKICKYGILGAHFSV